MKRSGVSGDLTLAVYLPGGNTPVATSQGMMDGELIEYMPPGFVEFLVIEVAGANASVENVYDVMYQVAFCG